MRIWMLVLFVFLVGCTTQESIQEISSQVPIEEISSSEPPQQALPSLSQSSAPKIPPPIKLISKELEELLTKAEKTVKSYEFTYAPPPDNLARDRYAIKGTHGRIKKIYRPNVVKPEEYFDRIYFDTEKKFAVAFCEERGTPCLRGRQNYPVDYESVVIKTPADWLSEIKEGTLKGPLQLFDRQTYQVTYEKDETQYFFWIDVRYGLVMRVVIDDGKEKTRYDYFDLVVNQLTDSEVMPKTSNTQ